MKIKWQCPHCGSINLYTNTTAMGFLNASPPMMAIGCKVGCRVCNGRSSRFQWNEEMATKLRLPAKGETK